MLPTVLLLLAMAEKEELGTKGDRVADKGTG